MPLLAWGAWTPDVSDYEGIVVHNISNVFPRGDGYGPWPDFTAFSASLPARCRGGFYALKSDGSIVIFAATVDRLYQFNNSTYTWTNVSNLAPVTSISQASPAVVTYANAFVANDPVVFETTGTLPTGLTAGTIYYVSASGLSGSAFSISVTPGGAPISTTGAGAGTHSVTAIYAALSSTAQWRFAQFNNFVIAVQANVVPQVFDITQSTQFAALGGSPPQASYVDVVNSFVILSGLLANPYRIQWSGLNAATTWTAGVNSSDYQDFPDGGIVRGVAGGDQSAIIFQDQVIRQMSYVPGSPLIFQITKLTEDKGLFAPYSIIKAGENVLFYSGQGFHMIPPGGVPTQIGRERVDRTFLANLDRGNLQLLIGAGDPRSSRVYWAYKSISGQAGLYDTILGYDMALDRWFNISMSGEYLLGISQTGITLESLDYIAPGEMAITATANNGSGLIRLSVASTATLSTGQIIAVDGVTGTVEANGFWTITVINGTQFDLQGSAYSNAYVGGGIVAGSIDALTLTLDAYATAVQPEISQFNSLHQLGFFRGPNLEAIMESAEQGTDAQKIFIRGFRPVTDAPTIYGSVSYRDTTGSVAVSTPEVLNSTRTGRNDLRMTTRYSRYKTRIPYGTNWTFSAGIEPDVTTDGTL